ncbi:proteasome regulatory particle lid subunit RPN3 [Sugiyamaella lignohabitans]|uniref:Proteasome regulatory particle lid subunit RPN3 n=1 Tax=Sugiyamaella lignohabitans TaxID=796027 RepID=A0A161HKT4_9ASCO|nr:proteasome regulatory particle lid subunit RPN3 [Sugiyamaella lignohabitans]ANB12458.1 proteasome regulatory particle lid subunit RPN3 [Sugiyamaella lignohabitans]
MTEDINMSDKPAVDVETSGGLAEGENVEAGEPSTLLVIDDIKHNFAYLEKAVSNFDPRFTLRVLRGLPALRKRVDSGSLLKVIESTYPATDSSKEILLASVQKYHKEDAEGAAGGADSESMAVDEVASDNEPPSTILPEVDIFLQLLVIVWLLNQEGATEPANLQYIQSVAEHSINKLRHYNRRSLDYLAAKLWFYYSRIAELQGSSSFTSITSTLLQALRTATLRHDLETQASLITLILRNYLASHKVSQAANLVAKTSFPESAASNALGARYLYYLARINAIQLNYSSAFEQVTAAIRKAPQTSLAVGFLQAANKLSIVVELLMGDIPDRSIFFQPTLEKSLVPYFDVAKAVRIGDLAQFSETLNKHEKALKADGTYTLVLRLRQNVIKTGIRIMSLTYSKISLKDICLRLNLGSEESAEYVVAKAIRDGVIDATIDHEKGYMQSKEVLDIYSTTEPQNTFHDRIKFCISLHNDSVKSMRYLLNHHRVDLKTAEEAREREKELATEIQEGTDGDDDDDFEL